MNLLYDYHELLTLGFVKVTRETVEKVPEPMFHPFTNPLFFIFIKKSLTFPVI
jgi:hypothetical protein